VVVYDITNAESFAKAKNWVKELQRQGNPNMIMALAGNKADLAAQRAVTVEEAKVSHSDADDKHMPCTACCNLCNLLSMTEHGCICGVAMSVEVSPGKRIPERALTAGGPSLCDKSPCILLLYRQHLMKQLG